MSKITVVVIYGGSGSERDISLASGKNVIANLKDKYTVIPFEIPASGDFSVAKLPPADVVFIALHGQFGEDGQLQTLLDQHNIRYTGSNAAASRLAFDKFSANQQVAQAGLNVPPQQLIKPGEQVKIPLPLVIKPNQNGSSIGVPIVRQPDLLESALTTAFLVDQTILAQQFIPGREFTCGVLGDTPLPSVEIITKNEFFDYTAKYDASKTTEVCPAKIPTDLENHLRHAALTAHRALGCTGLTRSDFIFGEDNTLYYLETNTIPGMTNTSLCPKEAAAAGLTVTEMLTKQIELALNDA